MLTENVPHQVKPGWYPFDGQLGPTQRSYRQRACATPATTGPT